MTIVFRLLAWGLLAVSTGAAASSHEASPRVGDVEKVYTLADPNTELRGLAFDDVSPEAPRLLALDRSGKVFVYRLHRDPAQAVDALKLSGQFELPRDGEATLPASPRGLAYAREDGRSVVYFLDWQSPGEEEEQGDRRSRLWRFDVDESTAAPVDLSLYVYRIGDREPFDLAYDRGNVLVCFDASGYADQNRRVQRGIAELRWNEADAEKLTFVRHLPDAGTAPSRGLAGMELEGTRYVWATVGNDHVYCADGRTGRGLFHFDRPTSTEASESCWGLAFGDDALWVSENVPGPDRVHRVNVTRNLDAPRRGPRILRRLVMTIETEPEEGVAQPGYVRHYYSRPYACDQLPNQGVWPETEKAIDASAAPNATIELFTYDPAGDRSSRQHMSCVEYADAPPRAYSSQYEIDLWTNPYRKFVYPHRVDKQVEALEGTDYLADDPELFNLSDTTTYDAFVGRVVAHIEEKYGVAADMQNPYWAARNVLEYIQDHYYYPNRSKRIPAAVDYDRKHYDANPANRKIALSGKDYDKSQIIACSGTSVMLAGAMRYLGIPARWLGTGTERSADAWDTNGNGLLDAEETAPCTNGHRYTQVWLGSRYGWVCFDATPSKPELNDYDPPPPIQPQWRYMNRAAAGHLRDKRIVFNVGSALFRPLYREFEYDEDLAVDNDCGGDQRYNLQGRFEKPEAWKLPRHRIAVKNVCFIREVAVAGPKEQTRVTWKLEGAWDKDPGATVSLYLERIDPTREKPEEPTRLAEGIPCDARAALVDLSGHGGKHCRVVLRKDGDPETGGRSEPFDVE